MLANQQCKREIYLMSDNPLDESIRDNAGIYGAVGALYHLRNQSLQQAKLAEQTEELKRQNRLIEEQNRMLAQQQQTNENRLEFERNKAELEAMMVQRVKTARHTMTAINNELDLIDRSLP